MLTAFRYERYLNMNDEDIFNHLKSIGPLDSNYDDLAKRLVTSQLNGQNSLLSFPLFICRIGGQSGGFLHLLLSLSYCILYSSLTSSTYLDPSLSVSYLNLCFEDGDILPDSDRILLLIHAIGGTDVPSTVLRSARTTRRRWAADGEIQTTNALGFGMSPDVVDFLSDEKRLSKAVSQQDVIQKVLDDGSITWSISSKRSQLFHDAIQPKVAEDLTAMGLRLICFACPPCYECNIQWYAY